MLSIAYLSKKLKKIGGKGPFWRLSFVLTTGLFGAFIFYNLLFWGRIPPGVSISGLYVGGLTQKEAALLLEKNVKPPTSVFLSHQGTPFEIGLESLNFSYDFEASSKRAFNLFRTGNTVHDLYKKALSPFKKEELGLILSLNDDALNESLLIIASQIVTEPTYPGASYSRGVVLIERGEPGTTINKEALRREIGQALSLRKTERIELITEKVDPSLSEEEILVFRKRTEVLVGKRIDLVFEYQTFSYNENDIFALIDPLGGYNDEEIDILMAKIANAVNREPQSPVFVLEGGKVKEFIPSKEGAALKEESLKDMIVGNLRTLETTDLLLASLDIPVATKDSEIKTGEVNDLGIKSLVGRGSSTFHGSIASRVHNIGVASGRFNGVLIKPGEVFSFNQILGDVSSYTGYKQAYIIKDGQTVLGDGGGVCQVSTTLFRAILDAGLPIVERRAHSYRVGYYEQDSSVGFDATIYSPTTDLKFKNDTPAHLLVQSYYDPSLATLDFEIYGTDDGRVATTTKPLVTNLTEPPEDLYTDDPTLPAGVIKQIDYKAWGAKASFTYKVTKDGEIIYQKTFYSNYQPWQAKFLRGTAPQT